MSVLRRCIWLLVIVTACLCLGCEEQTDRPMQSACGLFGVSCVP